MDLLSLRLVSRECSGKVHRTFKKVHFTEKAFLLANEESLRTLFAITQNEDFGKAIKSLVFCVDELPRFEDSAYASFLHDPESTGEDTSSALAERQIVGEDYVRLHRQQMDFKDHEYDLYLLTTICAQLRRNGNCPAIQIKSKWDMERPAVGQQVLERLTGEELTCPDFDIRPNHTVLKALDLSGLNPTNLAISSVDCRWSFNQLGMNRDLRDKSANIFANLTHLDLCWTLHDADGYYDEHPEAVTEIFDLVSSPPDLKSLRLQTLDEGDPSENGDEALLDLVLGHVFEELQALALEGFVVRFAALVQFLRNHPKLETLGISHCEIHDIHLEDFGVVYTTTEERELALEIMVEDVTGFEGCQVERENTGAFRYPIWDEGDADDVET